MKAKMRFPRCLTVGLHSALFFLVAISKVHAEGVLLIKSNPTESLQYWKPVGFTTATPYPSAVAVRLSTGQEKSYRHDEIGAVILKPDFRTMSIVNADDWAKIRLQRQTLQTQFDQYSQVKDYIAALIVGYDSILENQSLGKVLLRGVWMDQAEYDKIYGAPSVSGVTLTVGKTTYKNVKVSSLQDGRLGIMHEGGIASVQFSELTNDQIAVLKVASPSIVGKYLAENDELKPKAMTEEKARIPVEAISEERATTPKQDEPKWFGAVAGSTVLGSKNAPLGSLRGEIGKPDDDTYFFFQSDKLIGVTKSWYLDEQTFDVLWEGVMKNFIHGNLFERREYRMSGILFTESWVGFKDAIVIVIGNRKTDAAWRPPPDGVQVHVISIDYMRDVVETELESFVDSTLSVVRTDNASGVEVSRFGEKTVVTNKHLQNESIDPWRASRKKELRTSSEVEMEASGIAHAENELRQRIVADYLTAKLAAEKLDPYRDADTGDYGFKLKNGTLITVPSANQVIIKKPPTF